MEENLLVYPSTSDWTVKTSIKKETSKKMSLLVLQREELQVCAQVLGPGQRLLRDVSGVSTNHLRLMMTHSCEHLCAGVAFTSRGQPPLVTFRQVRADRCAVPVQVLLSPGEEALSTVNRVLRWEQEQEAGEAHLRLSSSHIHSFISSFTCISMATVMGPTPPGTGVINPAF